jgi:hypothetical protein
MAAIAPGGSSLEIVPATGSMPPSIARDLQIKPNLVIAATAYAFKTATSPLVFTARHR